MYDTYSHRWELLQFHDHNYHCGLISISTAEMPTARAGHAMTRHAALPPFLDV